MPANRISSKKIRAIFKLLQQDEIVYRRVAKALNISRASLKKYVSDIRSYGILHPEKVNDVDSYITILYQSSTYLSNNPSLLKLFPDIFHAISDSDSTRKVEGTKYKSVVPNGYSYSQFCNVFSNWCKQNNLLITPKKRYCQEFSEEDRNIFIKWKRSNNRRKWKLSIIFLELMKGLPLKRISQSAGTSQRQIKKWLHAYEISGISGLEKKPRKINEMIRNNMQIKRANIIKLIHESPKLHGINRSAWGIKNLAEAYFHTYGVSIGKSSVSKYIKDEGYAFKKARKVLTSPDPLYREKLCKITSILSNLTKNEKFFSVDEFGPFAIKLQGGRSLVKKDEIKTYPQWQKSKGHLICTAALELSENQVTHFFSGKKNTDEIIKLVEILIEKYKGQNRIFFSWDAASWHASKKLYTRIDEINCIGYRKKYGTPVVELAPLPASAQFLNVIESIFSGMAKAIIHNSNYQSIDECKSAINLYFKERNEYFILNPKRAGNKIWGKEKVITVFNEAAIYKDPKWR